MAATYFFSRALSSTSVTSVRQLVLPLSSLSLHARRRSSAAGDPTQFLASRPGAKAKIIDGVKIAAAVKAEVTDEVGHRVKLYRVTSGRAMCKYNFSSGVIVYSRLLQVVSNAFYRVRSTPAGDVEQWHLIAVVLC